MPDQVQHRQTPAQNETDEVSSQPATHARAWILPALYVIGGLIVALAIGFVGGWAFVGLGLAQAVRLILRARQN